MLLQTETAAVWPAGRQRMVRQNDDSSHRVANAFAAYPTVALTDYAVVKYVEQFSADEVAAGLLPSPPALAEPGAALDMRIAFEAACERRSCILRP